MKQVNIKSERVVKLLEQLVAQTGKSKVSAVTTALELCLQHLAARSRAERTRVWLAAQVWPNLPSANRGQAPTKAEQEELLGY